VLRLRQKLYHVTIVNDRAYVLCLNARRKRHVSLYSAIYVPEESPECFVGCASSIGTTLPPTSRLRWTCVSIAGSSSARRHGSQSAPGERLEPPNLPPQEPPRQRAPGRQRRMRVVGSFVQVHDRFDKCVLRVETGRSRRNRTLSRGASPADLSATSQKGG
jgi:hypothetical protein